MRLCLHINFQFKTKIGIPSILIIDSKRLTVNESWYVTIWNECVLCHRRLWWFMVLELLLIVFWSMVQPTKHSRQIFNWPVSVDWWLDSILWIHAQIFDTCTCWTKSILIESSNLISSISHIHRFWINWGRWHQTFWNSTE